MRCDALKDGCVARDPDVPGVLAKCLYVDRKYYRIKENMEDTVLAFCVGQSL